ncbi:MAG: phosphate signaling complex protein PhoU [Aliidongia sp.]
MDIIAPRATLDRQMADLRARIIRLGDLAIGQIDHVLAAVEAGDAASARAVAEADRHLDLAQCEIEQLALKIMALQQPEAHDLRVLVSTLAIAASLERIGDHAKTIAKRLPAATVLATLPQDDVAAIGDAALGLMRQVMEAFAHEDAALALTVRDRDAELDGLYHACFERVVRAMERDGSCVRAGVFLIHAARNLERIGDHATNIAERIHFDARGCKPKEERRRAEVPV